MSYRRDAQLIMLDARPHDALRLTVAEDRDHAKTCRADRLSPDKRWEIAHRAATSRDVSGGHRGKRHTFVVFECGWMSCHGSVVVREADLSRVVALVLPEGGGQ